MNHKIQHTPLYKGTYLLLMTAIAALQSVEVDGVRFLVKTLFWATIYGAGFLCGSRYRKSEAKSLKVIGNLVLILGLLFALSYLTQSLEYTLVVSIMWLQAGRNFTLCRKREFYFTYVISLIIILYAASLSQHPSFSLYLALYVLSGMFVLMADYVDNKLTHADGGDKDILSRKMNLSLRGFEIALITIVLAALIYLLLPRFTSPNIHIFPSGGNQMSGHTLWKEESLKELGRERQKNGGQNPLKNQNKSGGKGGGTGEMESYSGFKKQFNICRTQKVLSRDEIVFLLKADRSLYCRGKVFRTFDGESWNEDPAGKRMVFASDGLIFVGDEYRETGVKQKYLIMKNLPPLIFSAYRPNALIFQGNAVSTNSDHTLESTFNLYQGMMYYLKSDIEVFDGRPSGGAEEQVDKQTYLQTPQNVSRRIESLAHAISDRHPTDYGKAKAIETYLKTNYQYSAQTIDRQWSNDPVKEFLFDLKKGHCEIFASSMVILLRHAGIPTRFVTGYTANRFNPFKGVFEVREQDAHAWVEAYLAGRGWVTFEPTPNFELPGKETGVFYFPHFFDFADKYFRDIVRQNPNHWWAHALEKLLNALKQILSYAKEILRFVKHAAKTFWKWMKDRGWWSILASIVFASICVFLYRKLLPWYFKWRLRRMKEGDPHEFILACYENMEKWFAEQGVPRPSHFTATEYGALIAERHEYMAGPIGTITSFFHKARYGLESLSRKDIERAYDAYATIIDYSRDRKTSKKN